jgi:hypothetical protein
MTPSSFPRSGASADTRAVQSTFFPVLGFFAIRVADHIEIIDFLEDDDYWDSVGDDPDD